MSINAVGRPRRLGAFTLLELVVVIIVITIIAGLLLLTQSPRHSSMMVAKTEEINLVTAISQYKESYRHMPVSSNAVAAAATAAKVNNDFTFGNVIAGVPGVPRTVLGPGIVKPIITPNTAGYQNVNSEVISILRDDLVYPEAYGELSHIYNPQKTTFFNAKIAATTNSPGIDTNSVFRDPWGSPYFVTLDMNGDGKCYDQAWMAWQGGNYFVPGDAMVWSPGLYKTCDYSLPLSSNVNKYIVTSWK